MFTLCLLVLNIYMDVEVHYKHNLLKGTQMGNVKINTLATSTLYMEIIFKKN